MPKKSRHPIQIMQCYIDKTADGYSLAEEKEAFTLAMQEHHKLVDALEEVERAMNNHPELKELDGSWPRGSLYGIVRAALLVTRK